MNMPAGPRPYRMGARAEAAARTGERILAAAVDLWRERSLDEITLQAIAERAGVSVQTVIRRYGSRDGVVAACVEDDAADVRMERGRAPVGDVGRALAILMRHYERDGDAVLRTLALEGRVPAADAVAAAGRASHRDWCARVFAPFLPEPGEGGFEARLDAFVAVTDVYLWKLLRRDLGRSAEATERTVSALLAALATPPSP
jgi:AcrR family transcriptional regulator